MYVNGGLSNSLFIKLNMFAFMNSLKNNSFNSLTKLYK